MRNKKAITLIGILTVTAIIVALFFSENEEKQSNLENQTTTSETTSQPELTITEATSSIPDIVVTTNITEQDSIHVGIGETNEADSENITLNKNSLSLTQDNTYKLYIKGGAQERINWSSSDESVATVDSEGRITAITEGTATITAETPDGKTDECTVTVKGKV